MTRPRFLITIDTEGDNLWSCPRTVTTENSRYLPRFQMLCERYGFKPTYLTNWEMANCSVFQEFARDALQRGTAEVGMHLHAWNSPPSHTLTADDHRFRPYLIEYPREVMRAKIETLTARLEDVFACPIVSHRAGRWAINSTYARLLAERGYQVDCSVTPHVSWHTMKGRPDGEGGTDYRSFPSTCYRMNLERIECPGVSPLLEVPMTIVKRPLPRIVGAARRWADTVSTPMIRRVANRLLPEVDWLRPNGRNRHAMLAVLRTCERRRDPYAEFMLHSSELMPGGSPRFASSRHIERLYDDLECLFAEASRGFDGATLCEFRTAFDASEKSSSAIEQSHRFGGGRVHSMPPFPPC